MRIFFFTFILIVLSNYTYSQGTYYGCYSTSTNAVHTSTLGGYYLPNTGRENLDPHYCSWTPNNTGSNCTVCTGGVGQYWWGGYYCNGAITGKFNAFTMVACPIDDYIPFILLAIGGFGFFCLRGKNKFAII